MAIQTDSAGLVAVPMVRAEIAACAAIVVGIGAATNTTAFWSGGLSFVGCNHRCRNRLPGRRDMIGTGMIFQPVLLAHDFAARRSRKIYPSANLYDFAGFDCTLDTRGIFPTVFRPGFFLRLADFSGLLLIQRSRGGRSACLTDSKFRCFIADVVHFDLLSEG